MVFNRKAPDIVGIKPSGWINSKPLNLEKLKGKVVLLDFWTYSCINCIRTLPALKAMWKKYNRKGLVIIGIHTPEFEFEKKLENVKKAVKKYGLKYPIANDPNRTNWDNYGNQYWPRAALINAKGQVIFDHVGESGYIEIEDRIIKELIKMGKLEQGIATPEEHKRYKLAMSKETYAGSSRNTGIGSAMVCTTGSCETYHDPGNHKKDVIYLSGEWKQLPEFSRFVKNKGYIAFKYYAREVNIVIHGKGTAKVLLDDKPLTKKNAGKDIIFRGKQSYVKINGPDMYNIINTKEFHTGDLKIIPFKNMEVYAYTFG